MKRKKDNSLIAAIKNVQRQAQLASGMSNLATRNMESSNKFNKKRDRRNSKKDINRMMKERKFE